MNKFIIILVLLITSSCMQIHKSASNVNNKPHIQVVPFEYVDLNEDGNISEKEFEFAKESVVGNNNSSYKEPAWTFAGIMILVGVLILLSSLLNIKNRKKNVGD